VIASHIGLAVAGQRSARAQDRIIETWIHQALTADLTKRPIDSEMA
jgi:hypothetical protein